MNSSDVATTPGGVHDIQIIEDEQGMVVVGDDHAVDSWLKDAGLDARARKIRKQALQTAGEALQTIGGLSSQSGRWVKLTKESAQQVAKYGSTGTGVLRDGGKIRHILSFEDLSKASSFANPQMLTGLAGVMTQMAIEQAVDEITDYLETIDKKIDDLLQDQKDQAIANLVGVAHMIDETMMIREKVGVVTATTWSKVSRCPQDLARAQSYALLKIEGLAKKLAAAKDAREAEGLAAQLEQDLTDWISILGNAVQLQDKIYVVELDRVMAESPETLEQHRQGVIEARRMRLHDIEARLFQLNDSIQQSALKVRDQKVMHPFAVTHTLQTLDEVNKRMSSFAVSIGIRAERIEIEMAPRWSDAAGKLISESANQLGEGAKQLGQSAGRLSQDAAKISGETAHRIGKGATELGNSAMHGTGIVAGAVGDGVKKLGGLFAGKSDK